MAQDQKGLRTRHGLGLKIFQESRSRRLYAQSHPMPEGIRPGSVGECAWVKKKGKKKHSKALIEQCF